MCLLHCARSFSIRNYRREMTQRLQQNTETWPFLHRTNEILINGGWDIRSFNGIVQFSAQIPSFYITVESAIAIIKRSNSSSNGRLSSLGRHRGSSFGASNCNKISFSYLSRLPLSCLDINFSLFLGRPTGCFGVSTESGLVLCKGGSRRA